MASKAPLCLIILLSIITLLQTGPRPVFAGLSDLQVAVKTDKPAYLTGELVNGTILVSNHGTDPVTLSFASCSAFAFTVEDSTGRVVYDSRLHQDPCPLPSFQLTLLPGQATVELFTWNKADDSGVSVPVPGNYTIRGLILSLEQPTPTGYTQLQLRTVTSDLAITEMTTSRDFAYSGVLSQPITVVLTVSNRGPTDEMLTLTLKADGIRIGIQGLNLASGQTLALSFSWNADLPRGRYLLSAEAATPSGRVSSNFQGAIFTLRLKGDINDDCKVNIQDLAGVGAAFGSTSNGIGWNPNADLNNDGTVNIMDLATVGASFGQSCPSNVDITLGNDPNNRQQVEPTTAVHPLKPNIVIAGAQDLRLVANGKNRWHGYYRSVDWGRTWSVSLLPGYPGDTSPEGSASPLKGSIFTSDPVLTADRLGNVYYTGIAIKPTFPGSTNIVQAVFVARYIDDGATYHSTTLLEGQAFGTNHDKPWIAVDNSGGRYDGNVYLAWDATIGNSFTSVLARSTDQGGSFFAPTLVPETAGFLPVVTVDPIGVVYVSTVGPNDTIEASKSTNGGRTFTTVTAAPRITPLPSPLPGNGFRMFTIPQIAADANGVYLVWDDFGSGDADILFSRSANGGVSWTPPIRVNDLSANQQFFPTISASGGSINIAYYDSRFDDGGTITALDLFFTRSVDGGLSFLPSIRVTSQSFNPNLVRRTVDPGASSPFMGDYISIASTPTATHLIWTDNRNVDVSADSNGGLLDQDVFTAKIAY